MKYLPFGSKVKDRVTGFVGFVTARCHYMNGCIQYEVVPEDLKDGMPQKAYWLDWQQIEIVGKKNKKTSAKRRTSGGPQAKSRRRNPPPLAGLDTDDGTSNRPKVRGGCK